MPVVGNNIFIATNDATLSPGTSKVIAGTRTNRLKTGCESIEIASATQQEWQEFIAGRKSWSVSVGYLLLVNADVQKVLKAGTKVTVYVKTQEGTQLLTGSALITDADLSLNHGNLATGSFTMKGSGPLSVVTT